MSMKNSFAAAALAGTFALSTIAGVIPASAQTATPPAPPAHHLNIIQRHPTMTGIAAGVATHHALKVAAARDKARGKKLNFAERHPTLSGLAAGVAVHHEIKAHTPKQ